MEGISFSQSQVLNDVSGFVHVFGGRGLDTDSPRVIPESLRFLGIPPERVFTLRQVHSSRVLVAADDDLERRGSVDGDGVVCVTPGMGAAILTADCLPVFIASDSSPGFVVMHGGWRGLHAGVIENGLTLFTEHTRLDRDELRAAVGPGASGCCYEVGWDVARLFSERYPGDVTKTGNNSYMLDLKGICAKILASEGLPSHNIDMSRECTICNSNFHSVRRDRENRLRQVSVAYAP